MLTVKTPDEAFSLIKQEFTHGCLPKEYVPLKEACGRVLSADILADSYVPDFDRSTVDGYAVSASDTFGCSDSIPSILRMDGEILMGTDAGILLQPGHCAYIPTGGALPRGADAVVMIEYTEDYHDGTIGIQKPVAPGSNLIYRGDDVCPGKTVLKRGRRLTPQDIGALAAMGIVSVPVRKKPVVGILSTGDELTDITETPGPGQVRDVNSPMLAAAVEQWGGIPRTYGIIRDDESLLRQAVSLASRECDVILLSGGSSVGEKDVSCRIIQSLGSLLLHGIAMKPGKPTIIGKISEKPVVGLPGHPAAAFFVSRLFVRKILLQLAGCDEEDRAVPAVLSQTVESNHGRAQYVGVFLEQRDGVLYANPVRSKSGLITSLAGTGGYFCIPRDCEGISRGETVMVTCSG